jgi:hypothetical protein
MCEYEQRYLLQVLLGGLQASLHINGAFYRSYGILPSVNDFVKGGGYLLDPAPF